ncbi:MAG: hypothetical protein LBL97_02635 [Prevotellaceae bacterium]|jgi:hypothetical protein|nr:hypothetical protein [Prevotellaceae bacterium]
METLPASTNEKQLPRTLEQLVAQRKEMQQAIRAQQQKMAKIARESFAPAKQVVTKGDAVMRVFNTGMAVFDGVMLGLKLMRRIRKLF